MQCVVISIKSKIGLAYYECKYTGDAGSAKVIRCIGDTSDFRQQIGNRWFILPNRLTAANTLARVFHQFCHEVVQAGVWQDR